MARSTCYRRSPAILCHINSPALPLDNPDMFSICSLSRCLQAGRDATAAARRQGEARRSLILEPVVGGGRKDGGTARRLGRAVERVGGGAPNRVMRRGTMRLERRLVLVDLVEIVGVLV